MTKQKTLALFKPDVIDRNLSLKLIELIYKHGFVILAIETVNPSKELLKKHYKDLVDKPFFPALLEYMTSQPITALILEKEDAIDDWRKLMGATNPNNAQPGTIRGDYGQKHQTGNTLKNLVHGSDSIENAEREINLWFPKFGLVPTSE
jgi:nucleoside-diphosphate kinase